MALPPELHVEATDSAVYVPFLLQAARELTTTTYWEARYDGWRHAAEELRSHLTDPVQRNIIREDIPQQLARQAVSHGRFRLPELARIFRLRRLHSPEVTKFFDELMEEDGYITEANNSGKRSVIKKNR